MFLKDLFSARKNHYYTSSLSDIWKRYLRNEWISMIHHMFIQYCHCWRIMDQIAFSINGWFICDRFITHSKSSRRLSTLRHFTNSTCFHLNNPILELISLRSPRESFSARKILHRKVHASSANSTHHPNFPFIRHTIFILGNQVFNNRTIHFGFRKYIKIHKKFQEISKSWGFSWNMGPLESLMHWLGGPSFDKSP